MVSSADIRFVDTLITPPDEEPIDLDTVKKHLRRATAWTAEDAELTIYATAAREYFEQETSRQVIQATWERQLDAFPYGGMPIELPHPPLLSVVSLIYVAGGEEVTLDAEEYEVTAPAGPRAGRGFVGPVGTNVWPTADAVKGAVKVRFKAGYGIDGDAVPSMVKDIILLLVGTMYRSRDLSDNAANVHPSQITLILRSMIDSFKYTALPVYPPRTLLGGSL